MFQNEIIAFGITLFAGLSMGLGALLSFVVQQTDRRLLPATLSFSAGVMLYVAFTEVMTEGREILIEQWGEQHGGWWGVAAFFLGMAFIAVGEKLIPDTINPHAPDLSPHTHEHCHEHNERERLRRTGIFTAIAIAIHNLPEGFATFTSALAEPTLGVMIAAGVIAHNIPVGIAIAMPVYCATGSRKKAFSYALFSGLAGPLGALIGYLLLFPFLTPALFGLLLSAVAGFMVYISLDELLPAAQKYGRHHASIYGLIAGMALMAVSVQLFHAH